MPYEALQRRRVEAENRFRFVEQLVSLELTHVNNDSGTAFVQGVIE